MFRRVTRICVVDDRSPYLQSEVVKLYLDDNFYLFI
jgi:hypothetical protein